MKKKITSLDEDFARMGIAGKKSGTSFPSEKSDDGKVLSEAVADKKLKDVMKMKLSTDYAGWVETLELGPVVQKRVIEGIAILRNKSLLKDPYKSALEKVFGKDQVEDAIKSANESTETEGETLEEGLSVQTTKKMSPADRAAARRYRQKNRGKLQRQSALRNRKSKHKTRQARHAALKGNRKAGPRRRFVLNQSALIQVGKDMASLMELREFTAANNPESHEKLAENFAKIARNAQKLMRKFAVLEELQLGNLRESVQIEHPESEYDFENDPGNQAGGDKSGDATDYAGDSSLDANVDPEGSEIDDSDLGLGAMSDELELDFDIDDAGGDDDLSGETAHGDVLPGEGSEVDDAKDADLMFDEEDDLGEGVSLSWEMAKLQAEARRTRSALLKHEIPMNEAADALQDMVKYLSGAVETLATLAAKSNQYAGEDQPVEVDQAVEPEESADKEYIGQDDVEEVDESPDLYKLEDKGKKKI